MERKSQSHQKLLNFLDEFLDSEYFQDEVKRLRTKLNIPAQGLTINKELEDDLNKIYPVYNYFKLPKELEGKGRNILKELNLAIGKISKKITISDLNIRYFIRTYILYGRKIFNIINHLTESDLAQIEDFYQLLQEYPDEFTVDRIRGLFKYYPVVIKLHPAITQRDLIDYIKVQWPQIEYNLSQHRSAESHLGKIKKKKASIKERNRFIWENSHLPRKEIMRLLYDKYGPNTNVDYAYIGKIISLEKRKRKKL